MIERLKQPATKRALVSAGLVALLALSAYVIYYTDFGDHIRRREMVRGWIAQFPLVAPLVFLAAYSLVGMIALPVWWAQIVAGYCFGLEMGIAWCVLGDAIAAGVTFKLSAWLFGGWFQERAARYRKRLHWIGEQMGHNGLLVVMATRVCMVMPFGISNYLFGLTRMSLMSVILGTVLGGVLTKLVHVAIGADLGLLAEPGYWLVVASITTAVLLPIGVRYLKPEWMTRFGVE